MSHRSPDLPFSHTVFPRPVVIGSRRADGTPVDGSASTDVAWPRRGRVVEVHGVERLFAGLARPTLAPAKYLAPGFCPATLRGGRRLLANVEHCSMLALDVDHGCSLDQAEHALRDVAHLLYTSFSHTPEAPRFRVVVPLSRDVSGAEYRRLVVWGDARLAGRADPQASDPSRLFFRYVARPHGETRLLLDAPLLDVEAALSEVAREEARRRWQLRPKSLPPSRQPWGGAPRRLLDPDARRQLAEAIGARTRERPSGTVATSAPCPRCGDASVWFLLDPTRKSTAECNHRRSCGWWGPLDALPGAPR